MIEVLGLSKRFGSFVAVDNISLHVRAGEIFSFLGVNGAGKTTTLRMLAGILEPTAGQIIIGGYDLVAEPQEAKRITGYIPDRPYLYSGITGREYLYFISDLYNISSEEREERIDFLLNKFTLTRWQNELVESYSHGMKQRLATCGGLLPEPKVLIVDEPMVGLDPHGARVLKQSLKEYAESGMAVLLSTHSLHVAEELSHRLAIIHGGKVITTGTLNEVRREAGLEESRLEEVFLELTVSEELQG